MELYNSDKIDPIWKAIADYRSWFNGAEEDDLATKQQIDEAEQEMSKIIDMLDSLPDSIKKQIQDWRILEGL